VSVRVLIADDQALVRGGFRMILEAKEDMEVVGEAGDGDEAVALVERMQPDVVLMDVRMPGVDGIEATRRIAASRGSIRLGSSSVSDATQRTSSRTCAISVASSANLCEIAWKLPIGRPNWRRSLA
jgi:DNA-binding NarL/FixJ family response regulator